MYPIPDRFEPFFFLLLLLGDGGGEVEGGRGRRGDGDGWDRTPHLLKIRKVVVPPRLALRW